MDSKLRKIAKTYTQIISDNFQSFTFSTTLEIEVDPETVNLAKESTRLFKKARLLTKADIQSLVETDPVFNNMVYGPLMKKVSWINPESNEEPHET